MLRPEGFDIPPVWTEYDVHTGIRFAGAGRIRVYGLAIYAVYTCIYVYTYIRRIRIPAALAV